ncbi:MAG: hypothetical protein AB1782_00880 [Cyanobacteriota bacterium]
MGLDVCLDTIKSFYIDIEEDEDPEEYKILKEGYDDIIKLIKDEIKRQTGKLSSWNEKMPDVTGDVQLEERIGSYTNIHYLRRYAAHIDKNNTPPEPLKPSDDPTQDPLLLAIYDGESKTRFPHLIDHSDCNGFYIPCNFPEPLWIGPEEEIDEEDEELVEFISVGSSTNLHEELIKLNEYLNVDTDKIDSDLSDFFSAIQGDEYETEKWCWGVLYYMTLNSKMMSVPVIFT